MLLTEAELIDLTGKSRPSAQVRALQIMGIDHLIRPDGSVLVARALVEQLLGLQARGNRSVKSDEPNWESLNS